MRANKKHDAGIVSIMVTMVMIIVISLIVLGLAEISRTEQRNTTDDQLSVQAYYAAESGVSDALAAINSSVPAGQPIPPKPTCSSSNPPYNFSGVVNSAYNVSYTCITVNPTPTTLTETIKTSSTVIPLTAASTINSLTLDWEIASGALGAGTCNTPPGTFPTASSWNCNFPILRVDLLNANGSLSRANWSNNTATMFFVPTMGSSSPASLSSRGGIFATKCTPTDCTATINLAPGGTSYYMRVTGIYKTDSKLTITAGGTQFVDTQVVIDSTGKAQDILRRIQVAVDLTDANTYLAPSSALVTEDSICKQFGVAPGYFSISNPNMNNSGSGGDTLCQVH